MSAYVRLRERGRAAGAPRVCALQFYEMILSRSKSQGDPAVLRLRCKLGSLDLLRVLLVRKKLLNVVGKYVHEVSQVSTSMPLLVIQTDSVWLMLAEAYTMVLCSCSLRRRWPVPGDYLLEIQ